MLLGKHEKERIARGMVRQMREETETVTIIGRASGKELLDQGLVRSEDGTPIFEGVTYNYSKEVERPVPHWDNIFKIIDEAKDYDAMVQSLASYLMKYKDASADDGGMLIS